VDVICLRKAGEAPDETVNGVRYLRLPIRRRRGGKLRYLFEYSAFFALAFAVSCALALRRRYGIFQAHNFPDFLVFCGIPHRLRGAKVVLDLHDLMPELFLTKFALRPGSPSVRFLELQEKLAFSFCRLAITTSLAFRRRLLERSHDARKLHIVMNSPDERLFPDRPAPAPRSEGSYRLLFNGVIAHRSGPDVVIRALARVRGTIAGVRLDLFGSGDTVADCERLARELGVDDIVAFHGQIPFEEMPRRIEEADLGIVANRMSAFTALNFPTRVFEYLRLRKAFVVARTPGVTDYFGADAVLYFEPGDEEDLARAILEAYRDPARALAAMERGRRVYDRYRWRNESERYLQLLDGLA
jgi:glycosyltransferase involved in cell wall biosynthesis